MKERFLVAMRPILYEGREFKTGEHLPLYDKKMVDAWIGHGSAQWSGNENREQQEQPAEQQEQPAEQQEQPAEQQEQPAEQEEQKRGKKTQKKE